MNERRSGSWIAAKSGRLQGVIALLLGAFLGCDQRIAKTWDSGGKVEAKLSAQTCPSAQPCPSSVPLLADVSCTPYGDAAEFGFNAVFKMELVGSLTKMQERSRTEIWAVGCGSSCNVGVLRPDNVYAGKIGEGVLSAKNGRVKSQRGEIFEIVLDDIGEANLLVDLKRGTASFEQKSQDRRSRHG